MLETLLRHRLLDDYQTLDIKYYINQRKKDFPHLNEDFDVLKPYKTMITLCIDYPHQPEKFKGKGYGLVSRYSYGIDYHLVFESLFKDLIKRFEDHDIKAKGYADTGPVDERYAAYLSGLGYLGKNQFLIHPKHGTYVYLGVLLIDEELTKENYLEDTCGDCHLCIDACPTDALDNGFNKRLCTSYVTQAKEVLDMKDFKPLKTMIFGCDICQKVCPKNIGRIFHDRPEFKADEASQLDLINLLETSNKKIEQKYHQYAFSFRGGLVLKRNAIALLYNQRVDSALPLCKKVYENYKHVTWFEESVKALLKSWEERL